jgi:hypothetical protein
VLCTASGALGLRCPPTFSWDFTQNPGHLVDWRLRHDSDGLPWNHGKCFVFHWARLRACYTASRLECAGQGKAENNVHIYTVFFPQWMRGWRGVNFLSDRFGESCAYVSFLCILGKIYKSRRWKHYEIFWEMKRTKCIEKVCFKVKTNIYVGRNPWDMEVCVSYYRACDF